MGLPYRIATLLYCFNERDEVLLMRRNREPNRGLWSPCGGKLKTDEGESPFQCARREAREEIGIELESAELHLAAMVSESGYLGQCHWLMFLFEVRRRLKELPAPHSEGTFEFFSREALDRLELPATDRERIWPWFWEYRGGFFVAHYRNLPPAAHEWTLDAGYRYVQTPPKAPSAAHAKR